MKIPTFIKKGRLYVEVTENIYQSENLQDIKKMIGINNNNKEEGIIHSHKIRSKKNIIEKSIHHMIEQIVNKKM